MTTPTDNGINIARTAKVLYDNWANHVEYGKYQRHIDLAEALHNAGLLKED